MPFSSASGRAAVHRSWAYHTKNRAARTLPAREAQLAKLEAAIDPNGEMTPRDRRKAAKNARAARMNEMSAKASAARSRKAAERRKAAGDAP